MYSQDIAAVALAPFPSGEEDPTIESEGRTARFDAVPARPFADWVGPSSGRPVVYRRSDESMSSRSLALCLAMIMSRLALGAPRVLDLIAYQEGL